MVSGIEYEVDVRDFEYQRQAGKAWLARIYQPKGTGPFSTIVDVHGGAWHNGDRITPLWGLAVVGSGISIISICYSEPRARGDPLIVGRCVQAKAERAHNLEHCGKLRVAIR